jgi:hypothetical protein
MPSKITLPVVAGGALFLMCLFPFVSVRVLLFNLRSSFDPAPSGRQLCPTHIPFVLGETAFLKPIVPYLLVHGHNVVHSPAVACRHYWSVN